MTKCYCCPQEATRRTCEDCEQSNHCQNHSGCTEEKPDEWTLCDWCWEVRYAK